MILNRHLSKLQIPTKGIAGYQRLKPLLDQLIEAAQIEVSVDQLDLSALKGGRGFHLKPNSGTTFGGSGTPPIISTINQDIISDPYAIGQIITFWPVGSFFDETDPNTHFQWFLNGIEKPGETAFTFTWEITSGTVGTKDADDQAFPSVSVAVSNREGLGGKGITLHVDTTI